MSTSTMKKFVRSPDRSLACRKRVLRLLREIRNACRSPGGFTLPLEVLVESLGELEEDCKQHFRHEEQANEVPTFEPICDWEMAGPQTEHPEILKELREIRLQATDLLYWGDVDTALPLIAARFVAFHDRFLEHEARDEELLFDSYFQDSGGGD